MVILQSGEAPEKTMNLTDSKYILVKNHVRELVSKPLDSESISSSPTPKNTSNKGTKKRKKSKESITSENEDVNITAQDLEELKSVYNKCKAVLSKIESKYGHLLNLSNEEPNCKKRKYSIDDHECTCPSNTKIMFDDEGKQMITNTVTNIHICHKNLVHFSDHNRPNDINVPVSPEEVENTHELPDNLQELRDILKKPDISENFRNHVIEKLKSIRFQNLNTIKYGKKELIEKVKSNPNDIFYFEGANLSSLEGYPIPDLDNI